MNPSQTPIKPPLFSSTLKLGFGISIALHLAVAVLLKGFWHAPTLPSGSEEVLMLVPGDVIESILSPLPEPIAPPTPPEPPVAQPAPEPSPPTPLSTVMPEEAPLVPVVPSEPPAPQPPSPVIAEQAPQTEKPPTAATPPIVATPPPPAVIQRPEIAPGPAPLKAPPGIRATPIYRVNPEPPYPASARRRRQEGLVLLNVTVNAQGRASRVDIKQSSGFPALDDAALRAVRDWEFVPVRLGTQTFESEIEVPVRFKLTP